MEEISQILRQLDDWRHLPAYQLERRVDVLFGMLLPTVIGEKYRVSPENCQVIPEFPLHKGRLYKECTSNQSVNVDFAVFFEKQATKHLCLVELKTDQRSISKSQIDTMGQAAKVGPKELLVGVLEAAQVSPRPRKYAHLVWRLHEIGCIELPDVGGFRHMRMNSDRPGLTGKKGRLTHLCAANVTEAWRNARIDLIEIVPLKPSEKEAMLLKKRRVCTITFECLANVIRKARRVQPFGREFVDRFACNLDRWAEVPAGRKLLGE